MACALRIISTICGSMTYYLRLTDVLNRRQAKGMTLYVRETPSNDK